MKYADYNFNGETIFTYLEKSNILPFSSEVVPNEEIEIAFSFLYGEREVSVKSETLFIEKPQKALETVAKMLGVMFKEKWKLSYSLLEFDFSSTSVEKTDNVVTEKISSFDSEELLNDSETTDTTTRTNSSTQQYIKNITMLQDRLIHDIIFNDIRNTIFKQIIN